MPQGILSTAAGGAHYSGAKTHHRPSDMQRASLSGSRDMELSEGHQRVLTDLKEVRAWLIAYWRLLGVSIVLSFDDADLPTA